MRRGAGRSAFARVVSAMRPFRLRGPARAGSGVPPAGAPGRWRRSPGSAGHRRPLSLGSASVRVLPPFPRERSVLGARPRFARVPLCPADTGVALPRRVPGTVRKGRLSPAGQPERAPFRRGEACGGCLLPFGGSWGKCALDCKQRNTIPVRPVPCGEILGAFWGLVKMWYSQKKSYPF